MYLYVVQKKKEIKKKSNKRGYSYNSETGDIAVAVASCVCVYIHGYLLFVPVSRSYLSCLWCDGKTHQHSNLIEQHHMGFCFKFSTHFRTCLPMCRRSKLKRIVSALTQHGIDCRVEYMFIFVILFVGVCCCCCSKFLVTKKTHTTQRTYSTLNY